MLRYNVSQMDIPNKFNIEIFRDEIFRTKGKWEIAASLDKSNLIAKTKTVKPNIEKTIDFGDDRYSLTTI